VGSAAIPGPFAGLRLFTFGAQRPRCELPGRRTRPSAHGGGSCPGRDRSSRGGAQYPESLIRWCWSGAHAAEAFGVCGSCAAIRPPSGATAGAAPPSPRPVSAIRAAARPPRGTPRPSPANTRRNRSSTAHPPVDRTCVRILSHPTDRERRATGARSKHRLRMPALHRRAQSSSTGGGRSMSSVPR
jgi:hypothetical protein